VPGTGAVDGAATGAVGAPRVGASAGAGTDSGALPQATKLPTISAIPPQARSRFMTLLLLEALGAGLILVGIIWWTMFSGRKQGELPDDDSTDSQPEASNKNTR
jgi:hypothetical protein